MNHKHILAFILVILFTFSLFACGESSYAAPGESTAVPGEETESESIPEKPKTAFKRVKRAICKEGDTTETYDFIWDENSCTIKFGSHEAVAFYDPTERLFSVKTVDGEITQFIRYDENGLVLYVYDDDGADRYTKVTGYDENNVPTVIESNNSSETRMFEYDPTTRTVTREGTSGSGTRDDGTRYFLRYRNEIILDEFGNISAEFWIDYESIGDEEHFEFKEKRQSKDKWEYDADGNLIRFTRSYGPDVYEFEYSDEVIHESWERVLPILLSDTFKYGSLPFFWQLKG